MNVRALRTLGAVVAALSTIAHAYPLDGYAHTGIRRLEHTRALQARSAVLPPGATLPMDAVTPSGIDASALPAIDADASVTAGGVSRPGVAL